MLYVPFDRRAEILRIPEVREVLKASVTPHRLLQPTPMKRQLRNPWYVQMTDLYISCMILRRPIAHVGLGFLK